MLLVDDVHLILLEVLLSQETKSMGAFDHDGGALELLEVDRETDLLEVHRPSMLIVSLHCNMDL